MNNEDVVVLFDGECNLCNGTVRFLFQRDPSGKLSFTNLQSKTGQLLLEKFSLPVEEFDTFVLVEGEQAYTYSYGVLRAFRYLRFPWPTLARLMGIIPFAFRDMVYRWIARKRYGWFGKTVDCQIPEADLKTRFLS